jgi:hypothetical protein
VRERWNLQDRFGTVQGQCSHSPFQLTQQGLFSTSTVSLFNSHTSYDHYLKYITHCGYSNLKHSLFLIKISRNLVSDLHPLQIPHIHLYIYVLNVLIFRMWGRYKHKQTSSRNAGLLIISWPFCLHEVQTMGLCGSYSALGWLTLAGGNTTVGIEMGTGRLIILPPKALLSAALVL